MRRALLFPAAAPLLAQSGGIPVAATVVPPDQLRKLFSKDLNHEGYTVIEVAVYPADGTPLEVSPDEFTLRVSVTGAILTSRTPAQIAAGDKKTATS